MKDKLKKYNIIRNFNKSSEPIGKIKKSSKKLKYVIQHHLARKDHYDFRLEWNGTLKSWAVPKGPSFYPSDKRLAIQVEDHPIDYRNFEGIIPKGQYGGGTVMVWDKGFWEPINNPEEGLEKGYLMFNIRGERLQGKWALIRMKKENWLLVKEKDKYSKEESSISKFETSIISGLSMQDIEEGKKRKKKSSLNISSEKEYVLENVTISNPEKIIFEDAKITKKEIALYYQKIYLRMKPYIENRLISTIRCPEGINENCFFKKHLGLHNEGIGKIDIKNKKNAKEDFYYIKNISGLISEVQMDTIEFHIWGSKVESLEKPDMMVFDLDPDEGLDLIKIRQGVKDLKSILDELSLTSFLKTSGGKGYHIVVPIKPLTNWKKFREFAKNIAKVMEAKWPDRYVSNVRKKIRKNKIFVDWIRNVRSATSVAPYSIRIRKGASVSMPISWKELDKIAPDEIKMQDAIKRLKRKDPWENFYKIEQQIK